MKRNQILPTDCKIKKKKRKLHFKILNDLPGTDSFDYEDINRLLQ